MADRLQVVAGALRRRYGRPTRPPSDNPFELILWEQVAYLVPDERRQLAFEALRDRVGLDPEAIRRARSATLVAVARIGGAIAASVRARRMRDTAERVVARWQGRLSKVLELPTPDARRTLGQFAMIGEPGADKILAYCGSATVLPLDSNALRVVQRLGLTTARSSYKASYRQAQRDLAPRLVRRRAWLVETGQLLRQHGQELCRRSHPHCHTCPLRTRCPTGGESEHPDARRRRA
jgi:endonuclease-3